MLGLISVPLFLNECHQRVSLTFSLLCHSKSFLDEQEKHPNCGGSRQNVRKETETEKSEQNLCTVCACCVCALNNITIQEGGAGKARQGESKDMPLPPSASFAVFLFLHPLYRPFSSHFYETEMKSTRICCLH